ncbi:MAG: IclR family transcriptional regulator [Pseudonocardia sp.]|nr:IclR family transcriptional regulator [Pseudonocardia sp.]
MHTDHTPKPGTSDAASRGQTTLSHPNPPSSVVARLTAILATFRIGSAHSVTEMARLTGLPVSTTHRMANELASWNLLYRREDQTYEIGSALRGLGDGTWSFSALQQHGPQLLTDLSDATGHRARLGLLANKHVVYIEKQPCPDPATSFSRGATLPAHATAVGKALLAFAPHASVARIVCPMAAFTPRTIDSLDRLHHALQIIKVRKLAASSGEHFPGEFAIAAPVFAPDGTAVAALEVEVGRSRNDLPICRAALVVGAGALSRALATGRPGDYSRLQVVPSPAGAGYPPVNPLRPVAGG